MRYERQTERLNSHELADIRQNMGVYMADRQVNRTYRDLMKYWGL